MNFFPSPLRVFLQLLAPGPASRPAGRRRFSLRRGFSPRPSRHPMDLLAGGQAAASGTGPVRARVVLGQRRPFRYFRDRHGPSTLGAVRHLAPRAMPFSRRRGPLRASSTPSSSSKAARPCLRTPSSTTVGYSNSTSASTAKRSRSPPTARSISSSSKHRRRFSPRPRSNSTPPSSAFPAALPKPLRVFTPSKKRYGRDRGRFRDHGDYLGRLFKVPGKYIKGILGSINSGG